MSSRPTTRGLLALAHTVVPTYVVHRLALPGACEQQENLLICSKPGVCVEEHGIVHLINNTRE